MRLKQIKWPAFGVLMGLTPVIAAPPASMSQEQRVVHVLNRLTWGTRAADVAEVSKAGVAQWIERQLHPETITENPALMQKLAPLDTLNLSQRELTRSYPPPQVIRSMADGRTPWPADPVSRTILRSLAARQKARKEDTDSDAPPRVPHERPEQFIARLETMTDSEQVEALDAAAPGFRQRLFPLASPTLRRRIQLFSGPMQVVNQDLVQAKLLRAVYSTRQLEDVLADFWYNHFNVYLDKGADRYLVTAYERDVIRPHVLGKFGDLLKATAESPAMLFYLDNWQSMANGSGTRGKRTGLNENYGRELMELHTLGVDGGYSQSDVTEVARCFTGWTIRDPRADARFFFNPRMHDNDAKKVLGVAIPAGGGMEDGLRVLEILAHHPATARFLSHELAVRFVSDDPPASLVDKMARTYMDTDGDLREVLKTMFDSPEFFDPAAFKTRVKSPLELVASAIRASGADIDYSFALGRTLGMMGQPLYRKAEPTGYSSRGAEWMNSASLVARMNFASALARNQFPGVALSAARWPESTDEIARMLLGTPLSGTVRAALRQDKPAADDGAFNAALPPAEAQIEAGLIIGSPDFQRK